MTLYGNFQACSKHWGLKWKVWWPSKQRVARTMNSGDPECYHFFESWEIWILPLKDSPDSIFLDRFVSYRLIMESGKLANVHMAVFAKICLGELYSLLHTAHEGGTGQYILKTYYALYGYRGKSILWKLNAVEPIFIFNIVECNISLTWLKAGNIHQVICLVEK